MRAVEAEAVDLGVRPTCMALGLAPHSIEIAMPASNQLLSSIGGSLAHLRRLSARGFWKFSIRHALVMTLRAKFGRPCLMRVNITVLDDVSDIALRRCGP